MDIWMTGNASLFNRAVLEALPAIDFQPDVLHCHDWHAAVIPMLLEGHYRSNPFYSDIRTVFTIHNLLYQGVFPYDVLGDLLGLDGSFSLGWNITATLTS